MLKSISGHSKPMAALMLKNILLAHIKSHKMFIPFDPIIPLLVIFPKEIIQKKKVICTKMFSATLSIILKNTRNNYFPILGILPFSAY